MGLLDPGRRRITFAIPLTGGQYAPEVLYCSEKNEKPDRAMNVSDLSLLIESLPAAGIIAVDLLKADGNAKVETDWVLDVFTYTSAGHTLEALAKWKGVRIRAQSGGTAGDAIVSASWW